MSSLRTRRVATKLLLALVLLSLFLPLGCRPRSAAFVIALGDNVLTIDPIGSPSVDAASERVRTLMFNSLVKKDDKFDYVGELASDIKRSDDGLTFTFSIRDGVKFQDGRPLTSSDAKYTLDTVLSNSFAKSASFFEGAGADRKGYIKSVEAPDPRTLVVTLTKSWVGLLSNLVPVAIIPNGSYESEKSNPLGTGPFKFLSYDKTQQVLDLEAFPDYWEGAANIKKLRVRVVSDPNTLQAELQSGRVDLAPLPTSLSPDAFKSLSQHPNLKVQQFAGSNLNLLTFNTDSPPLNDVKVRQAICYAIDRESMIRDLLLGQAKIAHSILPEESWAYSAGQKYSYDPAKARSLLTGVQFSKPLVFKVSGSSVAAKNYAGVIQNYLKEVGVPVSIETAELNTMLAQVRRGEYQITYGQWVGGNQDPLFFKDLFASSEIPTEARPPRNRSRYRNPELDALIEEAVKTWDREKAKALYARIQDIVSRDAPILPLWYQANMVIAQKKVENINVNASGDWGFVRLLTVK